MTRHPRTTLVLIACTILAALSIAGALSAQTVTVKATPDSAVIVSTARSCRTACDDSTWFVFHVAGQSLTRSVVYPAKADTMRVPLQSIALTGTVSFYAFNGTTLPITLPARTSPAPTPVPAPVPNPTPQPPPASGALFSDSFERASIGHAQGGISYDAANVDISSAVSRTGTRSARFMAGLTKDRDWSELRFNGLANLPDVFLQYYVWQPAGFPIPQPGNDKFFRLWSGDYDASKIRVGASTWDGRIGIEYDKNFSPQNAPGGTTPMGLTGENYDGTTEPISYAPFLGVASYQNRWVRVRIHAKVASAANNDGVVQIWLDDALVLNRVKMPIYAVNGIGNYFTAGYLFGWANGKWPSGYVLYVDDFTISTTGFPN